MTVAVRVLVVLVVASLSAVRSAGADPVPAVPQLRVTPLRDAGGLTDAGQLGLNLQLTQGIVKYLTDQSQGRYTVVMVNNPVDTSRSARRHGRHRQATASALGPRMTLEGELSHVQSTTDKDGGGPYFCTLRLFLEGTSSDAPRRLTHEWAALARTYLDLTSNLSHDPHVDSEGLLGELAHRVIADVTGATSVLSPVAGDGIAPVQVLDSTPIALKKVLP